MHWKCIGDFVLAKNMSDIMATNGTNLILNQCSRNYNSNTLYQSTHNFFLFCSARDAGFGTKAMKTAKDISRRQQHYYTLLLKYLAVKRFNCILFVSDL